MFAAKWVLTQAAVNLSIRLRDWCHCTTSQVQCTSMCAGKAKKSTWRMQTRPNLVRLRLYAANNQRLNPETSPRDAPLHLCVGQAERELVQVAVGGLGSPVVL